MLIQQDPRRTARCLAAIICLSAIVSCTTLAPPTSSAALDAAKICGPEPDPVAGEKKQQLAALDAWLETQVANQRPEDLRLFQELFQADPVRRRSQIRVCHEVLSGARETTSWWESL